MTHCQIPLPLLLALIWSCSQKSGGNTLFTQMENSGIDFTNTLDQETGFDVFRYRNYYNGGGVGIGDIDNDGLPDVYMISNRGPNRLYKNLGDFHFEDITEHSGAGGTRPWSTGVAMADINGDGWLDIYVCNSGDLKGNDRENELFINNQNGTFTERASEYGLADAGFSTHAAFFDFDQDGDLDCYLLNNSFRPVATLPIENVRDERDPSGGDKFYLNDQGHFRDLSDSVGVFGSVIGFGLGITLLDINEDSWTDIYVSNDFFERDYLYINQQGKYFTEELEVYFDQTSLFSMGADAADLNNDGLEEVFVTDMLPPDRERLKRTTMFDSYDYFNLKRSKGFYNQFMKNTLHLNRGGGAFSEIGRYSGTDATDWSWGTLLFDMDNDGYKEVFITNGIYKDVTDQDFIAYLADESTIRQALQDSAVDFKKFVDLMPSNPLPNYAFKLDTLLKFVNVAPEWGLAEPSFSNGAAYGDLDNDGDLDLIVNNVNQEAFVYRNNSERLHNHYLRLNLKGAGKNAFAIGAQVALYVQGNIIAYHHYPTRGFESSMDYGICLGLGKITKIDSLSIVWDAEKSSRYYDLTVDTSYTYTYEAASEMPVPAVKAGGALFTKGSMTVSHRENHFVDFDRERLLYHQLSREGPAVAVADLNGDGLDDFYFGGAQGSYGMLYFNNGQDEYLPQLPEIFKKSITSEDVDAAFFDADNDGDLDLYVVSGGNELDAGADYYQDRLYLNEGWKGGAIQFSLSKTIPRNLNPGACVRPCDFDHDGDMDVFLGGRSIPGKYGLPADSYLLENDGSGHFTDQTAKYITQLSRIGLVTDAVWVDYDNDNDDDLVVVGEWMPVSLFENKGNFFQRKLSFPGLEYSDGLYYSVTAVDVNGDGYKDLVLGNLGQNSMFRPTRESPVRLFVGDMDENGTLDQIYTFRKGDEFYPYHVRNELNFQLSFIKKKFPNFKDYADKSMSEIFTDEQLSNSIHLTLYTASSAIAYNQEGTSFLLKDLPMEAQFSPVFEAVEINLGQERELVLLGNFMGTRPEESVYDANHGLVIRLGEALTVEGHTGLNIRGEVRAARALKGKSGKKLLIAKNNDLAEIYSYQ